MLDTYIALALYLSCLLQNGEKSILLWFLSFWGRAVSPRAETLSTVAEPFKGCGTNIKHLWDFLLHLHLRSQKPLCQGLCPGMELTTSL